jgi:tRNA pseudouridine55 synthase
MQSEFQNLDKTYSATIKLGYTTRTFDGTSEEENPKSITHLNSDIIMEVFSKFIGEYEQIPPMFSAKKVQGRKLYDLARKNVGIELKPNKVTIYNITIEKIYLPFVKFEVKCSKGTYIRSLANDIGKALGTGAYLSELRRTRIGNFSVENSLQIQALVDINNVKKVKNENL